MGNAPVRFYNYFPTMRSEKKKKRENLTKHLHSPYYLTGIINRHHHKTHMYTDTYQIIHVGLAGRVDFLQELQ